MASNNIYPRSGDTQTIYLKSVISRPNIEVGDYRNPLVAEAMRVMKYVNKFNRGVTRVQEMLKDNGNPPAEFDVNAITAFRVNVYATKDSDLSEGTSQGTSQASGQSIIQCQWRSKAV